MDNFSETVFGYENAPACKLLATRCAVCQRPLLDSVSVETGVGPNCRRKYGYDMPCSPEEREEANRLVYGIALGGSDADIFTACERLRVIGFVRLSDRILGRLAEVVITMSAGRYAVKVPYSPESVEAFRRVSGRRWDPDAKVNTFPEASRPALLAALRGMYRGKLAIGPKGPFRI